MTTCNKALALWSEKNDGANPEEAEYIDLLALMPPIQKMDSSLNTLVNCKKLSLSSNTIDRMIPLPGLKQLEILSLGRNQIKRIQGLEEVGATLKELWISYNHITTLDGLHPCIKLTTLFMSNNKIKTFDELNKLQSLPELSVLLLQGNPCYDGIGGRKKAVPHVLKQLPGLKTLDGDMMTGEMGDEQLQGIKDAVCGAKFDSVEQAFQESGLDLNASVEKAGFAAVLAQWKVSQEDAEYAFDLVAADGAASYRALADVIESA